MLGLLAETEIELQLKIIVFICRSIIYHFVDRSLYRCLYENNQQNVSFFVKHWCKIKLITLTYSNNTNAGGNSLETFVSNSPTYNYSILRINRIKIWKMVVVVLNQVLLIVNFCERFFVHKTWKSFRNVYKPC